MSARTSCLTLALLFSLSPPLPAPAIRRRPRRRGACLR